MNIIDQNDFFSLLVFLFANFDSNIIIHSVKLGFTKKIQHLLGVASQSFFSFCNQMFLRPSSH